MVRGSEKMPASLKAIDVVHHKKREHYVIEQSVPVDEGLRSRFSCCTRTCLEIRRATRHMGSF